MEMAKPMRIFSYRNTSLNIAVRGEEVQLVLADPNDNTQHWIQEYSGVGNLTDVEGHRAFALVNKATGQCMVSVGRDREMRSTNGYGSKAVWLDLYSGHETVELSKLWSLGEQDDHGFSHVRPLQNIGYSLESFGSHEQGATVGMHPATRYSYSVWRIVGIHQE